MVDITKDFQVMKQRLLDIAAQADAREGIRQGLKDVERGRVRPAREVLETFRRQHGIPRQAD